MFEQTDHLTAAEIIAETIRDERGRRADANEQMTRSESALAFAMGTLLAQLREEIECSQLKRHGDITSRLADMMNAATG